MFQYDSVVKLADFLHDFLGFGEDSDNALVVGYVVTSEFAAFAVLEPLLRRLVATYVEIPCRFRYIAKILLRINVYSAIAIWLTSIF